MKPARTTPEYRAKIVAEYQARPADQSPDDFAKRHGIKNGHLIQNWASKIKAGRGVRERLNFDDDFKRAAVAKVLAQGGQRGAIMNVTRDLGLKKSSILSVWVKDPRYTPSRRQEPPRDGRSEPRAFTDEIKRRAVAIHLSGKTLRETGEEFGTTSSTIHQWKMDPRYQPNDTALATNGVDPRQVDLFEAPQVVNRVEPHLSGHAIERLKNEVSKLREENARLTEDNNILRAIGTVAVQRGTLDLFLAKGKL